VTVEQRRGGFMPDYAALLGDFRPMPLVEKPKAVEKKDEPVLIVPAIKPSKEKERTTFISGTTSGFYNAHRNEEGGIEAARFQNLALQGNKMSDTLLLKVEANYKGAEKGQTNLPLIILGPNDQLKLQGADRAKIIMTPGKITNNYELDLDGDGQADIKVQQFREPVAPIKIPELENK
jgi:hypothetical protein